MKHGFKLFYTLTTVMLTAYICSVFTQTGMNEWYLGLSLPQIMPPRVVFPIVWSVLYVLLIISSFIALRDSKTSQRKRVNSLFITNMFLQILWCYTFFAQGQLGLGLAVLILLDISTFKLVSVFQKVNKISGYLLYPYYWWLIFATFLNIVFIYNFGLIMVF